MEKCPQSNKALTSTKAKPTSRKPSEYRGQVFETRPTHIVDIWGGHAAETREGPFRDKWCPTCGTIKAPDQYQLRFYSDGRVNCWGLRYQCIPCDKPKHLARCNKWVERKAKETRSSYEQWCESTKYLPKQTLTEEQWHKTIKYFKKCALCNEQHIETKEFFQKVVDGGTYSVWNVLPMCGRCSTTFRTIINPFEFYAPFNTMGIKVPVGTLERLLDFMVNKILEVANEQLST